MYFFVEFIPPQVDVQCFQNGNARFNWSLSPGQDLSLDYLNNQKSGWIVSGNCTHQNNVVVSS